MRIDLGIVQMELSGRPDGTRPEGHESLLEIYQERAERVAAAGEKFVLDPDDCARLMREGIQYYHRYLSAFHLERYELVARDTERNLRLFRFVSQFAARDRDKIEFDQYRPYVQMMHTRALASQALKKDDHGAAMALIDEGIKAVRKFLRDYHQDQQKSECPELRFLVRWRREVERAQPKGAIEDLKHQLEVSVALENFEEAARLRDQIRRLQETEPR
jgi:hypothetical protein